MKELTGKKAGAATAQTGYLYFVGDEGFGFTGQEYRCEILRFHRLGVKDLSNGKIDFVVADGTTLGLVVKGING